MGSLWTLQDTTLIISTGFPGISILGVGQLVIRRKVAKHLVTLVIHTRLSSSNWTLQLFAQEPPQLDTPRSYIRHMDNKVRTRSLSNWTLPGRPQPKLRLTLVIRTEFPSTAPPAT